MLKVKLFLVGKTTYNFLREGEAEYIKRLGHYCSFERIDFPDIKNGKSLLRDALKNREAQQFLKKIDSTDFVVLLDEKGDQKSSKQFAEWLSHEIIPKSQTLVFIVGGAFGFDDELFKRSQRLFSLSKMTFSHQMVRMIFLEQLYRAFTIVRGEPYHHE